MVKMNISYQSDLHCELEHESSGTIIHTDAPKDNMGKGESFSPTDLVGAALASCILTTLAIVAKRDQISIEGARASVIKEMTKNPPRRIESLSVEIQMPENVPVDYRAKLEYAAHQCPVHKSLHPDVQLPIAFHWK